MNKKLIKNKNIIADNNIKMNKETNKEIIND
jgi:hypothetical protein